MKKNVLKKNKYFCTCVNYFEWQGIINWVKKEKEQL